MGCVTFQIVILDEIYVRLEKGEIDITGSCYFISLQFIFPMLHFSFVLLFMNLNAVPSTIISQATPANYRSYKMQTCTLIYAFADIMIILRMKNLVHVLQHLFCFLYIILELKKIGHLHYQFIDVQSDSSCTCI